MGYANAFTTVVFVGNLAITCYRACTATQMIAICKMNERKNTAFGRGIFQEGDTFRYIINTVLIDNKEFSFYSLINGETQISNIW